MKALLYVVPILVTGVAVYFTISTSEKFEAKQTERLETIERNRQVTASAEATDQTITEERALLTASQEKEALLTASVDSLSSTGRTLSNEDKQLTAELAAQDAQFAEQQKTLEQVKLILAEVGQDVTLENLPSKINEIEEDRKARQARLEELEELVTGAERQLASSRTEAERLAQRKTDRNVRINNNAREAVVTAVDQEWGFLVIGAGTNSGYTPQTPLLVKRDGRFIGKVRPSSVEPTQTIAEIDFDSLAAGVRIQPGDRVILAEPASN